MLLMVDLIFFIEDQNPLILHSEYHGCWWPGDRSYGIGGHCIDLVYHQIFQFLHLEG